MSTKKTPSRAVKVSNLQFVYAADSEANPEDYLFQDPDYREEDEERLASFNRGDWHMGGIYASVVLEVAGTQQTIRTPGLWAIESDSGQSYFDEVAHEEYESLLEILASLGVHKDHVPPVTAAKWIER